MPDKKIYFMSYAVIQTGGKQYKVKSGEILKIEKLPEIICEPGRALVAESGSTIVRVNFR